MLIRAEAVSMTIVAEYVADLIVILTSTDKLNAVKKALSGRLKIKEMGHYCLGVSMILNADGIWLHQKQYVLSLLQTFGQSSFIVDKKETFT